MSKQISFRWFIVPALLMCGLLLAVNVQSDTGVGVFIDQSYSVQGEQGPELSATAFNNGPPIAVDIHVGIISQDGTIYEYPDWNTNLHPWLPRFTLPQNFNLPVSSLFQIEKGLQPGLWRAFAAFTVPGTLQILSLDLTPFSIVSNVSGGASFGALSLTHMQTVAGTEVDAGGIFIQSDEDLDSTLQGYEGQRPGLDQCVFTQIPIDLGAILDIDFITLDAGSALQVSSSVGSVVPLPKDMDAAGFGFTVYNTPDAQPTSGFFQGGVNYTFKGFGGTQVNSFTVSVNAPTPLNLTQPAIGSFATHNSSANLPLAWDGNKGVGEVNVSLSGSDFSNINSIECRFVDDGSGNIPSSLLVKLRDSLAGGFSGFPGIELPPGVELPPGFELPGLGTSVTLDVSRTNSTLFNTVSGDLSYGFATIDTGASLSITLE